MKKQILNSLTTAFFLSLVIFMSCGGDDTPDGPTAAETQFELLAKTWAVSSATADGSPVDGWDSFTVTFGGTATAGTYTTNGQQPDGTSLVWPTSGTRTWTFESEENVNTINRNDGVAISVAVSETSATLSFTITDNSGRADIVEGNWVFTAAPQ
ncbi:MAG: hypothetical protein AAFQ94_01330 [Bacteroidota bacterium]